MEKEQGNFALGYSPALNGIRAVAVLMVMMFHTGLPVMTGGFIGVDIFFVLSGFLISAVLLDEYRQNGRINLKKFYIRRALRLFPALLLLLLVVVAGSMIFFDEQFAARSIRESLFALFYISNLALAFSFSQIVFLGHTWSLGMEEQFYLLWPVLLLALASTVGSMRRICLIVFAMAVASWALRAYMLTNLTGPSIDRIFYGPDTRADGLLVGCALALLVSSSLFDSLVKLKSFAVFLKFLPIPAFLVLLLFSFIASIGNPALYNWQLFVIALSVAIVILDALFSDESLVKLLLERPVLVWIGSISYGLYLWHFLVYGALATMGFGAVGVFLLGIPLTFVIATLSYYFLERPFLRLKGRFR